MVHRATRGPQKLSCKWIGKCRVLGAQGIAELGVEALVSDARCTVHCSRLRLVCTHDDDFETSLYDMAAHKKSEYETVEEIIGTKNRDSVLFAHEKSFSAENEDDYT